MSRLEIGRRGALGVSILASAVLALPLASQAATGTPKPGPPHASTGGVGQVRGTSAQLEGTVNPKGAATTYFFQYGPTIAYGRQTASATLPAGELTVKVGLPVSGFLPGYHYRLVASNGIGKPSLGRDRTFATRATRLAFVLTKPTEPVVLGSAVTVTGTLSGVGGANQRVVLQASPYPYLDAFSNISGPVLTNSAGRFSFRIASLSQSTQFRVSTLEPRPLFSSVLTEHVAVRVTFKVRSSGRRGFVRLYGTVTPAEVGARVQFQLQQPARPGTRSEKAEERTVRFTTQAGSVVKRGTRSISRFSSVVAIRHGGRYRAFVIPTHQGALVSGSSSLVLIHSAPASTLKAQRKKQ
jgi:hypothetical protein